MRDLIAVVAAAFCAGTATAQSFMNWESPHVNPLDLTPDGSKLLAVNTADNRLEVFSASGTTLAHLASVPVGLEPVSVRARTDYEAWVVNHVSDSVSIVNLSTGNVRRTVSTGDEPADVVFAGSSAFVSVSQFNEIWVYPVDLSAAPTVIPIEGEDPRALATDGTTVFAAIFESGNGTTVLGSDKVSDPLLNPYPSDENPPPNDGTAFHPPLAPGLPEAPWVAHIVRKQADGSWRDGNGFDWSPAVSWDLHDHDVAMIDVSTLGVTYETGLMNLNMHLALRGSEVVVVGTEAINDVRFEPILNGVFIRVHGAAFTPGAPTRTIVDLNPHLGAYSQTTLGQPLRDQSIGDPRGVVFTADGATGYISGMGSNNVIEVDAALDRVGRVEVGEGPTGLRLNEAKGVLYVLNKFESSISVVKTNPLTELGRIDFFDPTPDAIVLGRPHLYDTHETSGLGHTSCASCHVDGRIDRLAWDLGDPSGVAVPVDPADCNGGGQPCGEFHPLKGPMVTQTLQAIVGTEPLHWRGDRAALADFNGAYESLLGDNEQLSVAEMQQFESLVHMISMPPNPFRNLDNTLPNADIRASGNPLVGEDMFLNGALSNGVDCEVCHVLPIGTSQKIIPGPFLQESQAIKIPQLRNLHERTGFDVNSMSNNGGFGYTHDGSVDTLLEFLRFPAFSFADDEERHDVEAYLLSFSIDTHAGIGAQVTLDGSAADGDTGLRDTLKAIAESSGEVGLSVKGMVAGEARGYLYLGADLFQSDRMAETATLAALDAGLETGAELTYTLVPRGDDDEILTRMSVDRDGDMHFDADEADACTDPANPDSYPGDGQPSLCVCPADLDGSGEVGFSDILLIVGAWGPCVGCPEDLDGSGDVGFNDILVLIGAWGPCE